jgi:hypothetical protein
MWSRHAPIAVVVMVAVVVASQGCRAATEGGLRDNVDLKKYADGVLSLMGYTVAPDVTTSSLSISNATTENPSIMMTQFGGGFTLSSTIPLYLEGNAAYARYDPEFVSSEGTEERKVPARWNAVSGTGGIGWDFPLTPVLKLRPIFNFTLGYVASDLRVAQFWVNSKANTDLDFLNGGTMNAYGLGGSVMLDYEDYRPDREIDVEMRYTNVELHNYGGNAAVQGSASAETASLWARWRAPTGLILMQRPVRYVLEYANTQFLSDNVRILGFDALNSIGAGIELDSSAHDIVVTRWRAVIRHAFGNNVSGWSLGLAVSF